MKKRIAFLSLLLIASLLFSQERLVRVGSQKLVTTSSSALTVPVATYVATMTVKTNGICMNFESRTATTSDAYYPPGVYTWTNQKELLGEIRIIDSADGASTVSVTYFGLRR